ncbi:FeoB-associated Cys-rich membrane protein [Pseudoflavonifractor sp. AF19-9AC]|uniref:FeoB-associated Cys-rich membrane protein n=1 Tax=Pseudoflavonifractor sp. AF19-9AC TaxID=2292244 RepID=UPI0018F51186|nr:FeoB-associated Cys-rich membrane protein [Pseudoflavonifractor sp. AF19-9AC]
MTDIILAAAIGAMVLAAAWYIIKAKRSGAKCIGCPAGGCCSHKQGEPSSCSGSCGGHTCSCHSQDR